MSYLAAKPPQTAFACARAAEHVSQLVISIPALALSFLEVPLLSRCGAALKPLFLAAQPSADRKTFSFLPLADAAAAPELSERVTKLEFQKHSWASALWAAQSLTGPASQMGRER